MGRPDLTPGGICSGDKFKRGGQGDYLGAFVIQFRVGEGWIKGESIQILLNSINNAEMWNWNWKSINKGRRLTP